MESAAKPTKIGEKKVELETILAEANSIMQMAMEFSREVAKAMPMLTADGYSAVPQLEELLARGDGITGREVEFLARIRREEPGSDLAAMEKLIALVEQFIAVGARLKATIIDAKQNAGYQETSRLWRQFSKEHGVLRAKIENEESVSPEAAKHYKQTYNQLIPLLRVHGHIIDQHIKKESEEEGDYSTPLGSVEVVQKAYREMRLWVHFESEEL